MSYITSSNFANKSLPELLEDIYYRINKLENYMLGIKQEKENENAKIVIDVDFNFEPARKRLQEIAELIPRKDD
jgi:hypothetical protein